MGIYQRYIKRDKNGNPVLDKDGSPKKEGPWFIQYPYTRNLKTGKIKYKTEKASFHKKKAEKVLQEKEAEFEKMEKFGLRVDTDMTFGKLIDWALEQPVMTVKASASDDVRRGNYLKKAFGNIKAVQITPLMVDNFRIEMLSTKSKWKRPFSGTTVNKMVSLGRRVYYLAMDAGIVKKNPFARRGVFKEMPKGRYIPDVEFRKMLKYIPDHLKPVLLTAYLTGMRRGEIIYLKWKQVDIFGGVIDLSEKDTKTEEPRHIFINTVEELKDLFVKAAKDKKRRQKYVFTYANGKPLSKWAARPVIIKACKKAGVTPFRLHDLRHTFNTNMIKAGVGQAVIMKLTGHKTNHMFLRYSHLDKEMGESAMKKLGGFLSSKDRDIQDGQEKEDETEKRSSTS